MNTFPNKIKPCCLVGFLLINAIVNSPILAQLDNSEPPSWLSDLNEATGKAREVTDGARPVPPRTAIFDPETLKTRLQNFVTEVDVYAETLRVLTTKYEDFLKGVAEVNATCDVDNDLYNQNSQKDFGWIYDSTMETCTGKIGSLKDYARTMGIRLDESENLLSEFKQHSEVALKQLDRLRLTEHIEQLQKEVNKADHILIDVNTRMDKFR